MPKIPVPDLTGQRFGKWLVLRAAPECSKAYRFLCRCDCGTEKPVYYHSLLSGVSTNCGCHKGIKHGLARGTSRDYPEYQAWCGMRHRCYSPKADSYPHYGGRGIVVCERWRQSVAAFVEDLGQKPSPDLSLDRIDNNANYSCGKCRECLSNRWPLNCRWGTDEQQQSNRRCTVRYDYLGESLTLAQWARRLGFRVGVLEQRLRKGWRLERALTTPKRTRSCFRRPGSAA